MFYALEKWRLNNLILNMTIEIGKYCAEYLKHRAEETHTNQPACIVFQAAWI